MEERQHKTTIELLESPESLVDNARPRDYYQRIALALAYMAGQQHRKALNILEHMVEILEKIGSPETLARLCSQHELGNAHIQNRQSDSAAQFCKGLY